MAKEIIERLEQNLDPAKTADMKEIYQFRLTGGSEKEFFVDFTEGDAVFSEGINENADIVLTVSDKNFDKILKGELNPNLAFMTGRLKIKGNMQLALKLQNIL